MQINDDYDDMFDAAGRHFNVDPVLLKTVFHIESGGNVKTGPSPKGALGPMQFMPKTAASLGVTDPSDMTQAVPAAAAYLRQGLDATHSPIGALRYYNGGPNGVNTDATIPYVNQALALYPTMKMSKANNTQKASSPPSESSNNDDELGDQIINDSIKGPGSQPTKATGSTNQLSSDDQLGEQLINDSIKGAQQTAPQPAQQAQPASQPEAPPQEKTTSQKIMDIISPDTSKSPLVMSMRNALQPGANDYRFQGLGRFLPVAHDEVTGENRLAVPQAVQQLGTGALDLIQGPRTGTVTPEGSGVLATAALAGKLGGSPVSQVTKDIPLSAGEIANNAKVSQQAADKVLSPEFKQNPFQEGSPPTGSIPKGPTSANPNFAIPEGAPTPTSDPNGKDTLAFANMIKDMIKQHVQNKAFGSMIRGGLAGHQLGGPVGAAIGAFAGPIIEGALSKLSDPVKAAVMKNLGEYTIPQTMMGGALNPLRDYNQSNALQSQ